MITIITICMHACCTYCRNDSKNTGYADPYAVKYHVETAAQVIQTAKKQVKSSLQSLILTYVVELLNASSVCGQDLYRCGFFIVYFIGTTTSSYLVCGLFV